MSKIIMMCGIPGSGKSTFCKEYFKNYKYISRDQIRFSLLKDDDDYFSKEKEVIEQLFKKIDLYIQQGEDFVIDATHLTKSSRRKILFQLECFPQNEIDCVYIKTNLKLALKRNRQRAGRELVPEKVIEKMYEKLEPPMLTEGFKKIITIEEG